MKVTESKPLFSAQNPPKAAGPAAVPPSAKSID